MVSGEGLKKIMRRAYVERFYKEVEKNLRVPESVARSRKIGDGNLDTGDDGLVPIHMAIEHAKGMDNKYDMFSSWNSRPIT